MSVSIARGYLLLIGVLFVAIGFAYLSAPAPLAGVTGLELPTPLARIEVRGFYGGQMVGLGAFVLLAAARQRFVVPGLLLTALSLGGTALGRIVGSVADDELPSAMVVALAIEIGGAGIALFLLSREREFSR